MHAEITASAGSQDPASPKSRRPHREPFRLEWRVAVLMLSLSLAVLGGCSTAPSTTCKDFGSRPPDAQDSLIRELIGSHGLDWTSNIYGTTQIQLDVDDFCGISPTARYVGGSTSATKNLSSAIDRGVNWSDYKK